MPIRTVAIGLILSLQLAAPFASPASAQTVLEEAFPGLAFNRSVDFQTAGDGRIFVVEQPGVIRVFDNDPGASEAPLFLDIRDRVDNAGGEEGLLGLAFHPSFPDSGYLYVNYTNAASKSVVSRFSIDPDDPERADPGSEIVLLTVDQPFGSHNGGQLAFDLTGKLLISFGDGGSGGDRLGNGQNATNLLGAILRIDVDAVAATGSYAIPPDNPFAGNALGYREEIFAYGLRNPWRFSVDPVTGRIWAGDVGQSTVEEVDVIESGKNYGWNIMEGSGCFDSDVCDRTGLTLPVWEYGRSEGASVTGGYVYRGSAAPSIEGLYVYGDYVSGRIWTLDMSDSLSPVNTLLLDTDHRIPAFGQDDDNELYVLTFGGSIYTFGVAGDGRPTFGSQPPAQTAEQDSFSHEIVVADPDGGGIVITSLMLPEWLQLSDSGNGSAALSGVPDDAEVGRHVVALRAAEATGSGASYQHFVLEVVAVNDAPSIQGAPLIVAEAFEDAAFTLKLIATDPDSPDLSWESVVDLPPWMSFEDNADRTATVSGTPSQADVAPESDYVFHVSDSSLRDSVTVRLAVRAVNDAPTPPQLTSPSDGASVLIEGGPEELLRVSWNPATDVDLDSGQGLSFTWRLNTSAEFEGSDLLSAESDTTFVDLELGQLASAMDGAGISPGGALTAYHSVTASDSDLDTMGPAHRITLTRGSLTQTEDLSVPTQFTLTQNYPNPFNPETTIRFGLPKTADVRLSVFDLSGRTIAVLASGPLAPGWHEATWNGEGLASGIYFYHLSAGQFEHTRSMLLLK
jgi:glucose/arabinose dehydrogenase